MKLTKLFSCLLLATASMSISFSGVSQELENYVSRSGKFTSDGSALLSYAEQAIVPKGWQVFFDDDNLRDFPIEWSRGENWQKYLESLGQKFYIAVIIDGSNRRIYFAKPSGMFDSGTHVLNPNSLVHSQNNVLKDIIRRSEVNLTRYEQRQIAKRVDEVAKERQRLEAAMAELELKRSELNRELGSATLNAQAVPMRDMSASNQFVEQVSISQPVNNDNSSNSVMSNQSQSSVVVGADTITPPPKGKPSLPPGLPSHSTPGSEETLYNSLNSNATAMPVVEASVFDSDVNQPAISNTLTSNVYADTNENYSFKIYQGLVIADNLRRFSEFIGYDIQLQNIPSTCDFESYANETITGKNKLAMFREYANRYFFSVDAKPAVNPGDSNVAVLTYNGDPHVFEGCMK